MDTIDLDGELGISDIEQFVYRSLDLIPRIAAPFHQREEKVSQKMGHMFNEYLVFADKAAANIAFNHISKTADSILAEAIYLSIRTNNLIQLKVKSNNY